MDGGFGFAELLDKHEGHEQLRSEPLAESRLPIFVPVVGVDDIARGGRRDAKPTTHGRGFGRCWRASQRSVVSSAGRSRICLRRDAAAMNGSCVALGPLKRVPTQAYRSNARLGVSRHLQYALDLCAMREIVTRHDSDHRAK